MYKLTSPDGYDFYSRTINYRDAIGTTIRVTDFDPPEKGSCGKGLYASRNPNDCFVGARIPCAAFKVEGVQKLAGDEIKSRYQGLKIIEEIKDLNSLFGWNYHEAINPINPFKIKPPKINDNIIKLVKEWELIQNDVINSVWDSIDSCIKYLIWENIRTVTWNTSGINENNTHLWKLMHAYLGSLFPNIKTWKYINHKPGVYPFQAGVDLWKLGLIPIYNCFCEKKWKLYSGINGNIVYKGKI